MADTQTAEALDLERFKAPGIGTPERAAWEAGVRAEAAARTKEWTPETRELVEFVEACAGASYTKDAMVRYFVVVYGPGLPWSSRWRSAWAMLRGYRVRRWYAEVEYSRSDFVLGVGVRWERDDTGLHIWVTAAVLVVHARKARR